MRILWNECKKILNIRLVLILAVFTALYYMMYFSISYLIGDNAHDIQLGKELIEEAGETLSVEEWDTILLQKKEQLCEKRDELVKNNQIFAKYGIETYEQLEEYHEAFGDKTMDELTEQQLEVYEEKVDFDFMDKVSHSLVFTIQEIERWDEFRYEAHSFMSTEAEAKQAIEETWGNNINKQKQIRLQQLYTRQEITLLPDVVMDSISVDMPKLAILI